MNPFSFGWNSIKQKIAEKYALNSETAVQNLISEEATEKCVVLVDCSSVPREFLRWVELFPLLLQWAFMNLILEN